MNSELIIGTVTISVLHGLIPSHWIPILALESKYKWPHSYTIRITLIAALSHALSTVLLGFAIGLLSVKLSAAYEPVFKIISSGILVVLGIVFILRHHGHRHFQLHNENQLKQESHGKIILVLFLSMFLSPCLEVEGYYVLAGGLGLSYILLVSIIYVVISIAGIVLWISFARKVLNRVNAHKIEHNSGLISGCVLIATGLLNYFLH